MGEVLRCCCAIARFWRARPGTGHNGFVSHPAGGPSTPPRGELLRLFSTIYRQYLTVYEAG